MGQIQNDIKYEDIKKGDYAFIKIQRDGVEDIGLLYYFDDDNSPRYLTHNARCGGGQFKSEYEEEYGYRYSTNICRNLYFHTTNLVDTLKVSIKMDSDFGEPRVVEILKDVPTNISSKMLERIQAQRAI